MPNLRIVYDNMASKVSGLTASTTAGTLSVINLLTDIKTEVWRSTGTTATLTLAWASDITLAMSALAFSNLSPTATLRAEAYTLAGDSVAAQDTGHVLCSAANFNGQVYATIWFAGITAQKLILTITDTANPSGFIQAGRLIVGSAWSPERDAESDSVKITLQDDSKSFRAESGTLWTERGVQYKKLSFDLTTMSASDRSTVWKLLIGNGTHTSLFISMMPDSADANEEQIHSIYGRLAQSSAIQYRYQHIHATQLAIEEV